MPHPAEDIVNVRIQLKQNSTQQIKTVLSESLGQLGEIVDFIDNKFDKAVNKYNKKLNK